MERHGCAVVRQLANTFLSSILGCALAPLCGVLPRFCLSASWVETDAFLIAVYVRRPRCLDSLLLAIVHTG